MDGIVFLAGILISGWRPTIKVRGGSIDQGYGGVLLSERCQKRRARVSTTTDGSRSARRGARLERGKEKALRSTKTWTGCRRPGKAHSEQDARERRKRKGEEGGKREREGGRDSCTVLRALEPPLVIYMGQPLIFLQLAKWLMDRRTGVRAALFCTEHALLATLITKLACTRGLTVSAAAARAYTVCGYEFIRRHGLRSGGKRCGEVDSISFRVGVRAYQIYINTVIRIIIISDNTRRKCHLNAL